MLGGVGIAARVALVPGRGDDDYIFDRGGVPNGCAQGALIETFGCRQTGDDAHVDDLRAQVRSVDDSACQGCHGPRLIPNCSIAGNR